MMTNTPETNTAEIQLTPAAVERVRGLLQERSLIGHALRVFVAGGGCSGLQYGMALEGEPHQTDLHFQFDDISVVVDPMSIEYLTGSVIDYVDDLMGGGFHIQNPNAVASCGCGHSFRTKEAAPGDHAGCC